MGTLGDVQYCPFTKILKVSKMVSYSYFPLCDMHSNQLKIKDKAFVKQSF